MSKMNGKTARTLLMVTVMIASALMPMVPEAAELRDEAKTMRTAVSTDVSALLIDEGDWGMYEVTLDQAPNGVLVVTPSSDNAGVTVDPAYLKFTKVNWDQSQYIYVTSRDRTMTALTPLPPSAMRSAVPTPCSRASP